MIIEGKDYITVTELKPFMGTSEHTIIRWMEEGMPCLRTMCGGRIARLFNLEDCQAWHRTTGEWTQDEKDLYYAWKKRRKKKGETDKSKTV